MAASHTSLVPLNVFLVEDSPPVRERIVGMLGEVAGVCMVGFAAAADEAVRSILERRPQVVLLDVKLAQGTGFDVLRGVRPHAPGIDFYMLSNFATPAYRRNAEELGARGFYDKSREFSQLLDLLAERAQSIA